MKRSEGSAECVASSGLGDELTGLSIGVGGVVGPVCLPGFVEGLGLLSPERDPNSEGLELEDRRFFPEDLRRDLRREVTEEEEGGL